MHYKPKTCITWVQCVLRHHPLFEKMIDGANGRREKKEHAVQKYCLQEQLIKYTYNAGGHSQSCSLSAFGLWKTLIRALSSSWLIPSTTNLPEYKCWKTLLTDANLYRYGISGWNPKKLFPSIHPLYHNILVPSQTRMRGCIFLKGGLVMYTKVEW
jgi:hypothetical protein